MSEVANLAIDVVMAVVAGLLWEYHQAAVIVIVVLMLGRIDSRLRLATPRGGE